MINQKVINSLRKLTQMIMIWKLNFSKKAMKFHYEITKFTVELVKLNGGLGVVSPRNAWLPRPKRL